jgi:hypothetical protein
MIGDADALVTKIADKLMAGQISTALRAAARTQLERRAVTDNQRVAEALYLIVTSPEFALQR